ncbi:cupin domain-containing protein [Paenibacillus mesotrionivorans]|uniref:Cupin domain-containing protein n=1 Tax=Paenibacillus mesotrionivorans TaxID=3160968 RepID=A0ACC7NQL7_9BACL
MEKKTIREFQEFPEGRFTKRLLFKEEGHVIFLLNFGPGQQLPTHKHPGADVYILQLEGEGAVTVNGTESALGSGEVVRVTGDEEFSYTSGGNGNSTLYVTLINIPAPNYAENIG